MIRFGQNQNLASSKASDFLRLWSTIYLNNYLPRFPWAIINPTVFSLDKVNAGNWTPFDALKMLWKQRFKPWLARKNNNIKLNSLTKRCRMFWNPNANVERSSFVVYNNIIKGPSIKENHKKLTPSSRVRSGSPPYSCGHTIKL